MSQIYTQVLTNDNDMSTCRCSSSYRKPSLSSHFTMATVLKRGDDIPLNFASRTILTLKPTAVSRAPSHFGPFDLNLINENGDILLHISFSTGRVTFCDRARRSFGESWGEDHTVRMRGRLRYWVTVSVHHYLTDSKFGRYQILLNGITVYHFDKRFAGPARYISYTRGANGGPPSWVVYSYQIDDLLPEERLALVPGM